MLDADNEVYPTAIGRLVEALDDDRDAVFAYSILEEVTHGKPTGLRSGGPWNPAALRHGNYIDAMSLLRRRRVLELGGYTDDVRLYGWEDFDLWCRIADHGGRGAFVPQILCRYHQGEHSMLTVTNIDLRAMWGVLRKRYPDFMQQA
jgi:GT2 family glycosyltransferase